MATLFKKQGSPFYWTAFFDSDGHRYYRSTRKKSRVEAVPAAAEMERLARRRTGTDDENRRAIHRLIEEAGQHALKGTLTSTIAHQIISRLTEQVTGEGVGLTTVEQWLRGWLTDKKLAKADATFVRYEGVVNDFLDSLSEQKRSLPLSALTIAEIRRFRDRLLQEGRAPATANMAVKILRTPLNLARKQGLIQSNPAEAVELIEAEVTEKGVFTAAQVSAMLAQTSGDWYGLILLGYFTGARVSDLANLKWGAVELEQGVLTFRQQKTKRSIEIPLHRAPQTWLRELSGGETHPESSYVFPSLAGKATGARNGLSGQFRLIMKKAGIDQQMRGKHGEKGRQRSTLSFHSLRHSFNSAMANAGVSQEIRQRLTGHASKAVNDRYTHTELDVLRKAVQTVPGLPSEGSTSGTQPSSG